MLRRARRRQKLKRGTPWGLPIAFINTLEKAIKKVVKKGKFRLIRNRVYTIGGLLSLLVTSAAQSLSLKSEIARYGKNAEGKPYTKQNLEYRLDTFDKNAMWALFKHTINSFLKSKANKNALRKEIREKYTDIVSIDGTTLDQVRHTPRVKKEKEERSENCRSYKLTSGGHVLVMISLSNQMVVKASYHADALVNETNFTKELLRWIRRDTLVVMDRGFYSFKLFEGIIKKRAHFIIPLRKRTRITVIKVLKETKYYRDSLVEVGVKPKMRYLLRMIEYTGFPRAKDEESTRVLLVSEIDPEKLPPEEAIRCYNQRWSIEKCFNQIKQPLSLCHLWSSKPDHIEIQVLATLIAYLIYNRLRVMIANKYGVCVDDVSLVAIQQALKALSMQAGYRNITTWLSVIKAIQNHYCHSLSLLVEHSKAVLILRERKESYFQALSPPQAA